jgi:hypothetical protein
MIDLPPPLTEHEQVESLAYRLYEDEGKPDGRARRTLGSRGTIYSRRTPRHRLFFGKIRYYPSGGLGLILVILQSLASRDAEEANRAFILQQHPSLALKSREDPVAAKRKRNPQRLALVRLGLRRHKRGKRY